MTTHYDTLGVAKTATAEEIKKAYRKLASQHHPDKEGGNTAKFQEIQAANEILSDPHKRANYDAELSSPFRHGNTGGGHFKWGGPEENADIADILDSLRRQFHSHPNSNRWGHKAQQREMNRDIRIHIRIDAASTLAEQKRTLNIKMPNGKDETVEITIPRGVPDGGTIRYTGLGDNSVANAPRGDLYVLYSIAMPDGFQSEGIDIYTEIVVNCLEAMTGCEKEVTALDGKTYSIKIPAGTQSGTKFAIADQGLYSPNHPGRGRLIVFVEVYILKELTEAQLNIIRDLQASL